MSRTISVVFAFVFMLLFAPHGAAQAINFDSTLRAAGAQANTSRVSDLGRWRFGPYTIEAQDRKKYVSVNGTRVYTGRAMTGTGGKFYIQKRDWEKHLRPILTPDRSGVPATKNVVIDAGHGGKDPGKINARGMREKTYALDIAKRLQRILSAKGYNAIMTRSRDEFVELESRATKANNAKADIFVSIHFNSAESSSPRGVETFMLTTVGETSFAGKTSKKEADVGNMNDSWNLLLAYTVHTALVNKIDAEDRGIKCANFAVLRPLKCPGILIECGFFTNPSEAALIATTNRREQIAQGIADGIGNYNARLSTLRPRGTRSSSKR